MDFFLDLNLLYLSIFVFIAGFIDSIAGGGGIITIPAYLNYGLKENLLLGTNKLSSSIGTLISTIKFLNEIKFEKKILIIIFSFSALGSFLGALVISFIPSCFLKYFLIITLPLISFFLLFKHNFGLMDLSSQLSFKDLKIKLSFISFFISFYDGLLGPGTGTFLAFSYSKFCKFDLLRATALSKFTNLISNLFALITFLSLGKINIKLGLSMALVSILGNFLGSSFALKKGVKIIRPTLFLISNLLIIKLIYDMLK